MKIEILSVKRKKGRRQICVLQTNTRLLIGNHTYNNNNNTRKVRIKKSKLEIEIIGFRV